MRFKALAENQCDKQIEELQTNNAREFLYFHSTLDKFGIKHCHVCLHTHQQMGNIERRHKHIVDTGLTQLNNAKTPLEFWDYSFMVVAYL